MSTRKHLDRALIGKLVEREIVATTTWAKFAIKVDVSRSTLYRVRDADPVVSRGTFARIERGLSLPMGTFDSVGAHDFDVLRSMGLSEELVGWLERQATPKGSAKSSAKAAPATPTKRGRQATKQV